MRIMRGKGGGDKNGGALRLPDPIRMMEALFDAVPDIVFFVKDGGCRYAAVNQTLVRRCGFARKADVIGRTAADLFPPPLGAGYLEQDRAVLRTGRAITDKLELHLYPGGRRGWCITTKVPIRDARGAVIGIAGLSRDLRLPGERHAEFRGLAESVRHIQAHFGETLRLEDLAARAALSAYQFEQRMKKLFDVTAGQFVMRTRIEAACDRLRAGGAPIADIALECGFYDQSAFARQFKAATGLTPTEYRRLHGRASPAGKIENSR